MSNIFARYIRNTGGLLPFNIGSGTPPDPAIYSQHLLVDDQGSIHATVDDPIHHYGAGLPFSEQGRLCVEIAAATYVDQNIPFTASGRVAFGDGDPGDSEYFSQGIGFATDAIAPLSAFSAAFNEEFQ